MIKDLIKIANDLDARGLAKEADALDKMIKNAIDADPATEAYMIYKAFRDLWIKAHQLQKGHAKEIFSWADQWQTMREDRWLSKVAWHIWVWNDTLNDLNYICDLTRQRVRALIDKIGWDHDLVGGETGLEKIYRVHLREACKAAHYAQIGVDERVRFELQELSEIIRKLPEDQLADFNIWSESAPVKDFLLKSVAYTETAGDWEGYAVFAENLIAELKKITSDIETLTIWADVVDSNLRARVRDFRALNASVEGKLDAEKSTLEKLIDEIASGKRKALND